MSKFKVLVLVSVVVLVFSCTKEPRSVDLTINPNTLTVDFVGVERVVEVLSSEEWQVARPKVDWVEVEVLSGTQFRVNVLPNLGDEIRYLDVVVSTASGEKVLSITQTCTLSAQAKRNMDSLALIALYKSTDGDNWMFEPRHGGMPWDFEMPFSEWWGVRSAVVNGQLRVLVIELNGTGLCGELPVELKYLTELSQINLASNEIKGDPFAVLSSIEQLQIVDLSFNNLNMQMPASIFKLKNVYSLNVASCGFTGPIPQQIRDLKSLGIADLSNNALDGKPFENIQYLSNLEWLNLSCNAFSGTLPESVSNMLKLTKLNISTNQFSGNIPQGVGLLSELEELNIGNCNFEGALPDRMSGLVNLQIFTCSGNKLTNLGRGVWQCPKLTSLDCSSNLIQGVDIPLEAKMGRLKNLELQLNSIANIGGSFDSFSSLERLNVSNNKLLEVGFVTQLSAISEFVMFDNLVQLLPQNLGAAKSLKRLVANNNVIKTLPESMAQLSLLRWLILDNNNIEGEIPIWFGDLKSLEDLSLASNRLTGSFPWQIVNAVSLTNLVLTGNYLSGTIPSIVLNDKRWMGETVTIYPEYDPGNPVIVKKPGIWSPEIYICGQRPEAGFENCM